MSEETVSQSVGIRNADPLLVSRNVDEFAGAWLKLQCSQLGDDIACGIVVSGPADEGPFSPVAIWPEGVLGSPLLVRSVESCVAERQMIRNNGSVNRASGDTVLIDVVVFPVMVDGQICGAAALEIVHSNPERTTEIEDMLRLGLGWLEAFFRRRHETGPDRLVTVLDLVATGLHHERSQMAATAVATDMARVLGCERVSIGFLSGQHSRVFAVSNSAAFGGKSNVIRAIEAAMDEAIDQQASVVYPQEDNKSVALVRAHQALANDHQAGCLCTVPLTAGSTLLGAIVFERPVDQPFDRPTVELCEHSARLVGPLLEVKRRDDRLLIRKAWDSARSLARQLAGPGRTGLKLGVGSALLVMLLLIFVHGDYRITADARLEGEIQRAVTAPISGYIATASLRAGDVVSEGDILFTLDDRELWLERLRAGSEHAQSTREYNEAVAKRDRSGSRVLAARIEQADAQIELIEQQLDRTQVKAPFDAVIVSGDLSQSLGAPVERGDVLFQVAPLDAYRIILEVNERDVSDIAPGQEGSLVLSSLPDQELGIRVTRLTPVAIAEEGNNFFVVEAEFLASPPPLLRPGMEGVGKVSIERRRLIWIWTYKITHWLKMFFWSWWP